MTIRWRKKDEILLRKKIRNYNAKIDRLRKNNNFQNNLLPEKLKYKDVKNNINERRDFKTQLSLINALTKRGSEKIYKSTRGLQVPQFEIKQNKIKEREINRKRDIQIKRYKEMGITDRNKSLGFDTEDTAMHLNDLIRHKKYNYKNKSKNEYEAYKNSLKEYNITIEQLNERYRENLYKSIESGQSGYTPEQIEKLKSLLDKIDTQTIVDKYYTDINMNITFNYELSENEGKFETYFDAWVEVLNQNKK